MLLQGMQQIYAFVSIASDISIRMELLKLEPLCLQCGLCIPTLARMHDTQFIHTHVLIRLKLTEEISFHKRSYKVLHVVGHSGLQMHR